MATTVERIASTHDLDAIRDAYHTTDAKVKTKLLLCAGAGCVSSGCQGVREALRRELAAAGLAAKTAIHETGCLGPCHLGPTLVVEPGGVLYVRLRPEDMPRLVQQHLRGGRVVEDLCFRQKNGAAVPRLAEMDFFKRQHKLVTARCGTVPYASLEAYIATDGYRALVKVLTTMTPEAVIEEMKASKLRGRGGGGFPCGIKWEAGRRAAGEQKYIVCNADEGDPGAFMDRSVLEGDPHAILEGMAIAGYAIGARQGFVYVRAEYPLAVERLAAAIAQARNRGLLGEKIFGSTFDFDVEIRIGAGAFVCGEETALMASVEGKRGEPRQKPPFPFESGIFGHPTIINNVETLANVPPILLKGGAWFATLGTPNSTGTKVFALAGDVQNTGIVEVEMGMTLGEIVFDVAGGMDKGKRFKAAQTGGPSGGCLTAEHLESPIDYDSLAKHGTIMGSGGLIVMDEDSCMVDVARFFMDFVQDESCGKCVPCRIGTKRMLEILERIKAGKGKPGDIDLLQELAMVTKDTSTCGLGQTAGNPVMSTVRHFRDEYAEHIEKHHCRAGVCQDLFVSPCQNACPAGVNVPGYIALIAAGRPRDAYYLVRQAIPFPGICGRVCSHPCESKCRRGELDEPIAICDLKRYAADYVYRNEEQHMDLVFPKKDISVGVVGAGPSGLTCAYFLARLGYSVQVYEAQPMAGGMLAVGIPEYRLPRDILAREIRSIEQVGVQIHTGIQVGVDIRFEALRNRHKAIYIATGTHWPKRADVPGEDMHGVVPGVTFLQDANLGRKREIGEKVVVIGGGSTAFDAARTAMRLGARSVSLLYRREVADMPADPHEVVEAREEGIEIRTLVAPVAIVGNGKVTGVRCIQMVLSGFDRDGRRRPQPVAGSEFIVPADLVIPAISQQADLPFLAHEEVQQTRNGALVVDPVTKMTSLPGVFAGGDVIRGPDVVITAIADGKHAAQAIDRYLGGTGELNVGAPIEIPRASEEMDVAEHERFRMQYLNPEMRRHNFDEVALGFHKLSAVAEAMRCLRCDAR